MSKFPNQLLLVSVSVLALTSAAITLSERAAHRAADRQEQAVAAGVFEGEAFVRRARGGDRLEPPVAADAVVEVDDELYGRAYGEGSGDEDEDDEGDRDG